MDVIGEQGQFVALRARPQKKYSTVLCEVAPWNAQGAHGLDLEYMIGMLSDRLLNAYPYFAAQLSCGGNRGWVRGAPAVKGAMESLRTTAWS